MRQASLGVAAVILLAACGGSVVAEPTGTSSGTGANSTTGTGASTTGTGAATTGTGASTTGTGGSTTGTGASTTGTGASPPSGPCPGSPPIGQSTCPGVPDGFRCTYGDSVRPDCRDAWVCNSGFWQANITECNQPTDCPASEPPGQTVCTTMGDECVFGDTLCYCGCGGGPVCMAPIDWQCAGSPTTPGCPAVVPNDGTACASEGLQCNYGLTCTPTNAIVNCTNGFWKWNEMIACG